MLQKRDSTTKVVLTDPPELQSYKKKLQLTQQKMSATTAEEARATTVYLSFVLLFDSSL